MSVNPKKILLSFSFILFTFYISFAEELNLKSLKVKNLPSSYEDIFKEFFKSIIKTNEKSPYNLDIEIKWIMFSYNICFFVSKNSNSIESICFTSKNAENILEDIEEGLSSSKFIKLKKNIKRKKINLKIFLKENLKENRCKIISSKGDQLTDYKYTFFYKNENINNSITLSGASITGDIIVLQENSSAFLLKKFLNGYKIDKIYIIK